MKREAATCASKKPDERANDADILGVSLAIFGGTEKHDRARRFDATPGRRGAAKGTADADVFGRANAIVRRCILQRCTV